MSHTDTYTHCTGRASATQTHLLTARVHRSRPPFSPQPLIAPLPTLGPMHHSPCTMSYLQPLSPLNIHRTSACLFSPIASPPTYTAAVRAPAPAVL